MPTTEQRMLYNLKSPGPPVTLRFVLWGTLCGLFLISSGCRSKNLIGSDKRYDLLEAELRTRERELNEAKSELQNLRLLNETYLRQPAMPGMIWHDPAFAQRADAVPTAPGVPIREVTLGTGTGGVDDDGFPGDESLVVVIVVKDPDGTIVKVPGRATVQAYEINQQGMKTQIGQWEVTPEQLRRSWKSGLLSNGYFVPLQWDRLPTTNRLRLVVKFVTLDGTTFETDKDVTIRPLPARPNSTLPPTAVPLGPNGLQNEFKPFIVPPRLPVPPTFGRPEELPPPAARFKRVSPL